MRRVNELIHGIVSVEDIDSFCLSHSYESIDTDDPSDYDKAYVIAHEITDEEEFPKFRIVISTRRCLSIEFPLGDGMINADASYRILREKCPIFLIGFSDKNRVFHCVLIGIASNEKADDFEIFFKSWKDNYKGNGELNFKFIMSDGASSMYNGAKRIWPDITRTMCFAHVFLVSLRIWIHLYLNNIFYR